MAHPHTPPPPTTPEPAPHFHDYDPYNKDPSGDTTFMRDHEPTPEEDRFESQAAARRAANAFEHH